MEILKTQVGETIQKVLRVEIRIKSKDRMSLDLWVIHKVTKDRC